ncbi:MAG: trypsin-like peptidase domain-containing protein [Paludibacteraceae bacterium]|nr:trypsin-like peptidase domain-containing protein [Paludibacteraceae bacterium]
MKNRSFTLLLAIAVAIQLQAQYNPYQTQQPTDWSGTGWMLNKGYVVTNNHVAENARTIVLKFQVGDSIVQYSGEVALQDPENDLALIRINDPKFKGFGKLPYALKTQTADVGESVFVLGYPMTDTMGDEIKLTTGIVSSLSGYQGGKNQYQISAPVQPGNSGGPLFDENGNIIGIVNAKHSGAENVSYAVKATHLQTLVSKLSDKGGVLPTSSDLQGLNLPQKVKKVKGLVCFIHCSTRGETPRSATPKYGVPTVPKGSKIVENPYVDFTHADAHTRIRKVTLTDKETIIEISATDETTNSNSHYICINEETYIRVNGETYRMKKAEGIAIFPKETTFPKNGGTITFRLIFPAIPKATTSLDLIEPGDSDWQYYGISLKEY